MNRTLPAQLLLLGILASVTAAASFVEEPLAVTHQAPRLPLPYPEGGMTTVTLRLQNRGALPLAITGISGETLLDDPVPLWERYEGSIRYVALGDLFLCDPTSVDASKEWMGSGVLLPGEGANVAVQLRLPPATPAPDGGGSVIATACKVEWIEIIAGRSPLYMLAEEPDRAVKTSWRRVTEAILDTARASPPFSRQFLLSAADGEPARGTARLPLVLPARGDRMTDEVRAAAADGQLLFYSARFGAWIAAPAADPRAPARALRAAAEAEPISLPARWSFDALLRADTIGLSPIPFRAEGLAELFAGIAFSSNAVQQVFAAEDLAAFEAVIAANELSVSTARTAHRWLLVVTR